MYTLGYSFKPWNNPKPSPRWLILEYLRETAREYGSIGRSVSVTA